MPSRFSTLLLVVFLAISCSTLTRTVVAPPDIPGATYVGNRSCAECHTNITRIFPASPHARVHVEDAQFNGQAGCESCHGPGSKHVEAGGGRGKFIVNPGKNPAACFQCHLQTETEFRMPQHHPVIEGQMNCVQCHDPHGGDIFQPSGSASLSGTAGRAASGGLAMARLNQNCAQCHREQARPFVFEHEAMREGCTVCHNPHGSPNRKLLIESDLNLCLKCHAQVQRTPGEIYIGNAPHAARLRQGGCWTAGCHTAVHGSNVHPRMLY